MTLGAGSFPEPPEPKENDNQYIIDELKLLLKMYKKSVGIIEDVYYNEIHSFYLDNDLGADQWDAHGDEVDVVIEVELTIQKLEEENENGKNRLR